MHPVEKNHKNNVLSFQLQNLLKFALCINLNIYFLDTSCN